MIIAIDGPSAVGKGTLSKRLADHFHLRLMDTGLLYRALAYEALQKNIDLEDAEQLSLLAQNMSFETFLNPKLRSAAMSMNASKIAKLQKVREVFIQIQRDFAKNISSPYKGAILDGRDIGTVILPDANIKFFLTATPEERALRRYLELRHAGEEISITELLRQINIRDEQDATRAIAPLKAADDAYVLDTSKLSADEVFNQAIKFIEGRLKK